MSILIKGLTIPPDSDVAGSVSLTIIRAHDGTLFARDDEFHYGEDKGRGYKAIEIPPHGRLIDADALHIDLMDRGIADIQTNDWYEIRQAVDDAPTIIESEKKDG